MTTLTPVVSVQRWWGKDYPEGHLCCAEYLSWISSCLSERIVHSFHISPASRTELNLTLLYRSVVECAAAQPNGAPQWLFINIMQVYRELTVLKLSLEAGEVKANSRLEITEMCRKKTWQQRCHPQVSDILFCKQTLLLRSAHTAARCKPRPWKENISGDTEKWDCAPCPNQITTYYAK